MGYIESGKRDGATVHLGGGRHGTEGYFVQPTIFTECKPDMKIVQEEIFGPVAAIIKFKTEEGRVFITFFNEESLGLTTFSLQRSLKLPMLLHMDSRVLFSLRISAVLSVLLIS